MLHAESDSSNPLDDRQDSIDRYCRRALEILADARARFSSEDSQVLIADAYVSVGDSLEKSSRADLAEQAWSSARNMFTEFSKKETKLARPEIDKRLHDVDERLQKIRSDGEKNELSAAAAPE
jgi:hypothetical protein